MKIALDYDETYSLDPEFWLNFMLAAKAGGHYVSIVTFRDRNKDWNGALEAIEKAGYDVWCTGGVAKRWWCLHYGPGKIDIWIDDKPESVTTNSSLSPEDLDTWRGKKV